MLNILLVDGRKRARHYEHLRAAMEAEWRVPALPDDLGNPHEIDIALISDEWDVNTWLAMRELQRAGVPVLHVADGIVEWRNCWENPRSQSAERGIPLFQPVLADKIACVGRSQARVLSSWTSPGRCEVVGSPRLDALIGAKPRTRLAGEPFRIMVATARTPFFTDNHRECLVRALHDIREFDGREAGGVKIELHWRLTRGLDEVLGLPAQSSFMTGDTADAFANVDALITSPSTLMVEGMLVGLPVAVVDYANLPQYTPPAWSITAPEHLDRTIGELMSPPPARLLHQDMLLHDALECRTPATPRMVALIQSMAEIGRKCRARGVPVVFPEKLLEDGPHVPQERFDLGVLYPGHPVFGDMDRTALQLEVSQLRIALARASSVHVPARQWGGLRELYNRARKLIRFSNAQ